MGISFSNSRKILPTRKQLEHLIYYELTLEAKLLRQINQNITLGMNDHSILNRIKCSRNQVFLAIMTILPYSYCSYLNK